MIDEYLEEKILDKLTIPHVVFSQDSIQQKKTLAWHISVMKEDGILLASIFAFSYAGIIAGFSEKQAIYITNNAPEKYKQEILKTINTEFKVQEILEIAQAMDEDLGRGVTQNQERVKNVMQYIKDNRVAFEF